MHKFGFSQNQIEHKIYTFEKNRISINSENLQKNIIQYYTQQTLSC